MGMQREYGRRPVAPKDLLGEKAIVNGTLALFAGLLALVTVRHEMFGDEAQAWLIARDSRNLLELAQHLRYEGHPALWYVLLYLPSHLSVSLAWMQALNYALSVTMAWLVLRERRLPLATRVLSIFSVFVFFHMGVPARSYMLAAVLLVGAARCLLADRSRHWLAMVLLALAINTHFLAIPAAAGIFVWLYWLDPVPSGRVAIERLRERRFWISTAILGAALAVCYLTLRPAPDGATPDYDIAGASWLDYLMIGTGRLWSYSVPFIPEMLRGSLREKVIPELHPSAVAAALSVGLWLLVVASLATRRGRWFFASTSLLWMAAMLATVHTPSPHHVSTLFVILLVAQMLNSQTQGGAVLASVPLCPAFARAPAGDADGHVARMLGIGVGSPVFERGGDGRLAGALGVGSKAARSGAGLRGVRFACPHRSEVCVFSGLPLPRAICSVPQGEGRNPTGERGRDSGHQAVIWRGSCGPFPLAALGRQLAADGTPPGFHVASWGVLAL
jgi:hypothetical protein